VDQDLGSSRPQRLEHREALDVIPVVVREEHLDRRGKLEAERCVRREAGTGVDKTNDLVADHEGD
jgi:hypothetical protein